jgi:ABC-2 type transport system ATP-binding protein
MSDEIAIKVENVSKYFLLPHQKSSTLKSSFLQPFKRYDNEKQMALKDVSFDIKKGEFFGIVGRNGSGKSTLLKCMAGVYTPDKGHIKVDGSLVPFIELGVGFNPELSGRDNVFLNGALLGFSRPEIEKMYEEIVEFSELEEHMDQKLKNYSSGMQVRLAFSIATRAEGDILLLDEVLAVGDGNFQKKCINFFEEIKGKKTIVLVTHDMSTIKKYCDRALLLENGNALDVGKSEDITLRYGTIMKGQINHKLTTAKGRGVHIGSREISIEDVFIVDGKGKKNNTLKQREKFTVCIKYKAHKTIKKPGVLVSLFTKEGTKLFSTNTNLKQADNIPELSGEGVIKINFPNNLFAPGAYKINVGIFDELIFSPYDHYRDALAFEIEGERIGGNNLQLEHIWEIK